MTANQREQELSKSSHEPESAASDTKATLPAQSGEEAASAFSSYAEIPRHVWAWVRWSGEKTFDGLDFAGEVVADFLGLTRSKYQWILDMHEREQEEKRQRRLEAQQRRQLRLEQLLEEEQRKLQELETGGLDDSEDEGEECPETPLSQSV